MGGLTMLQQELEALRQKALKTISDYIRDNGKHGYVRITYKGNPDCFASFSKEDNNSIPYLQWCDVKGNNQFRINGDTLDGIVEIADAIDEYKKNVDWVIYPLISVRVKATSQEKTKEKAIKFLTDKGIEESHIIINDSNCFKV